MKKYKIIIFSITLSFFFGCTDIDETLYDRISADTFYQNEEEVLTGLTNVYYKLMLVENWWWPWQLQECSTDHGMTPTRNNGAWLDGGVFHQLNEHTWDSTHDRITVTYTFLYSAVASVNSFLEIIENSSIENKDVIIAEVRAVRAWEYLRLIDLYGNVPIVTDAQLDSQNLPTNSSRSEVFDFIEGELLHAVDFLPSLVDMNNRQDYYPRVAKETAQAMLVRLYLNAQVYSGNDRLQDCINISNEIINSGVYSLTPSIGDSFEPLNQDSPEIIFAISQDNIDIGASGGNDSNLGGNWINQLNLRPELKKKLNVSFDGWGGPSVLLEHYEIYDADDYRRTLILAGLQTSPDGDSLTTLIPIQNVYSAALNEGFVNVKYEPDPQSVVNRTGRALGRNDLVLFRYAEILMSKAEALYRLGSIAEATALINMVRARNFQTPQPFVDMQLQDILEERSREFLWEGTYRTDLVRFGKFDEDPNKNVYPIPLSEIQSNPNLVQNPGY